MVVGESGELVPDYLDGVPVGEYDKETRLLKIYNHLQITVKVHKATTDEKRIVGFEVHPMSRAMNDNHSLKCDHTAEYDPFYLKPNEDFLWSYCIRTQVICISLFTVNSNQTFV